MYFLVLILAFIAIHGALFFIDRAAGKRMITLRSILLFSTFLVVDTELLSINQNLNLQGAFSSWLLLIVVLIIVFRKADFRSYFVFLMDSFLDGKKFIFRCKKWERIAVYSILGLLFLTFFQGLIYPPNNWDSMTYHMTRIVHWVSNESVAHYPTGDYRQLNQPPFVEFFIMQVNLLFGSDLLAHTVQWIFLIFSCLSASLLAKEIGLNGNYQLFAVFFVITIPIVLFQASSTKNFLVQGFFLLESSRHLLKYFNGKKLVHSLFGGLAIGLALLTKATAYIFLFPMLFFFGLGLIWQLFENKKNKDAYSNFNIGNLIQVGSMMAFLAIAINLGHYFRGINLVGHPLGILANQTPIETIAEPSIGITISNIFKNIALHFGPFPISVVSELITAKLHEGIGYAINTANFNDLPFQVSNYPNGVGDAPNIIHLLLLFFGVYSIFKLSDSRLSKVCMIILFIQLILFCAFIKWQPWHSRMHSSLFMLASPLVAFGLSKYQQIEKYFTYLIPILSFYAFAAVLVCNSRPLIYVPNLTNEISPLDSRFKRYFAARPEIYSDYQIVKEEMDKKQFQYIGNEIIGINYSYPLFNNIFEEHFKVYNINVTNFTKDIPHILPELDCIITQKKQGAILDFDGKKYQKIALPTEILFLYEIML